MTRTEGIDTTCIVTTGFSPSKKLLVQSSFKKLIWRRHLPLEHPPVHMLAFKNTNKLQHRKTCGQTHKHHERQSKTIVGNPQASNYGGKSQDRKKLRHEHSDPSIQGDVPVRQPVNQPVNRWQPFTRSAKTSKNPVNHNQHTTQVQENKHERGETGTNVE